MSTRSRKSKICTVIGGCGFLGRHMVELLLDRGYQVNVFDIQVTFKDDRVRFFTGDLCKKEDLLPALEGVGLVFHHASPPASCPNRAVFYKVNVEGTRTLIEACKEAGVQRFVLTSSASVVYDGSDIKNGTEDLPYADKPMDYYTETKIIQEKLVLDSNNSNPSEGPILLTVAIRPHGIIGPRDTQNIPTIANAAKEGKMKFVIGDGKNLVNFTYVENVVLGHLMAAESLYLDSKVCGKAYNITNDEPVQFGDYLKKIVTGLNYPPPSIHLPYGLMLTFAIILDWICWVLSPLVIIRPLFTPMRVRIAGTYHYYSSQRAREDFDYRPSVNYEDGIQKSLEYFEHLKRK